MSDEKLSSIIKRMKYIHDISLKDHDCRYVIRALLSEIISELEEFGKEE